MVELLLLTRRLFDIRRSSEAVDTATPSTASVATSWNVEVRNTATTRLTYSSGCHSAAVVFSSMNVYISSAPSHLSLRIKSPKLSLLFDGREIAMLQVQPFHLCRSVNAEITSLREMFHTVHSHVESPEGALIVAV